MCIYIAKNHGSSISILSKIFILFLFFSLSLYLCSALLSIYSLLFFSFLFQSYLTSRRGGFEGFTVTGWRSSSVIMRFSKLPSSLNIILIACVFVRFLCFVFCF